MLPKCQSLPKIDLVGEGRYHAEILATELLVLCQGTQTLCSHCCHKVVTAERDMTHNGQKSRPKQNAGSIF